MKITHPLKSAHTSASILALVATGKTMAEAWDAVLGAGEWQKFADQVWADLQRQDLIYPNLGA